MRLERHVRLLGAGVFAAGFLQTLVRNDNSITYYITMGGHNRIAMATGIAIASVGGLVGILRTNNVE